MSKEPTARQISAQAVKLREAGRQAAAESLARFAMALEPKDAVILANAGNVLLTTDKSEEALRLTARAISLDPTLEGRLLQNMGLSSAYSGDMHAALLHLRKAEPTLDARYDLACMTLLHGDWIEGMKLMEVRRELHKFPAMAVPEWDGAELDGTLWVEAEQGIGDMIQFARFIPWARSRCKRLVFSVPAMVMAMFYGYPGIDEVRLQEENVPAPEALAHVPLQSLAHLYGATQENLPADPGHFVKVAGAWPVSVERNPRAVITVGLVWAGSPRHPRDRERSIPFERAMPLLEEARAQFFSLQIGPRGGDAQDAGAGPLIEDVRGEMTSWMRSAPIIGSLDLIVTVDTAVAHMAGAIGVPTWLMVPKVPDWRWGLKADRTPWYPSLRLFRQKRLGHWEPVVDAVKAELAREIGRRLGQKQERAAA